MYKFTKQRFELAKDVLRKYAHQLDQGRTISCGRFERELKDLWDVDYQGLKGIFIDLLKKHPEYEHLAVYYMENVNAVGVVSEFQIPLAKFYGLTSWHHDPDKKRKRVEFWEKAFALHSEFDVERDIGGANILEISSEIQAKLIESFIKNPQQLHSLSSRNFEELIAKLYDGFGFQVELTKATRDGGVDIIAVKNTIISPSKYLIECKRYAIDYKVGIQPVRALHGVVNDQGATQGILATTSSFTAPAQDFIDRNKWTLSGRAFNDILEWLKEYQRIKLEGK